MFNNQACEILKNIDDKSKKNIAEFCSIILRDNPSKIQSICLFGEKNTILFVLSEEQNTDFFYKNTKIVKKFNKKNIISLFMTKEHILTSQDVFPLEFMDIKNSYSLLFGNDIFEAINIDNHNLRLQAEQQMKGLLIRFYQIFLEIGDNKRKTRSMINNSFDTIFTVLRAVVMIKENKYVVDKAQVILEIRNIFRIDLDMLFQVLEKSKNNEYYDKTLVNSLIKEMQDFAYILDGIRV